MPQNSATQLALVEAIPLPNLPSDDKRARAAIRRCCKAWQRVFDASLAEEADELDKSFAAEIAAPAYCKAMPPLAGYENIRDFIACAAHGILIQAIPEKRANQLLYAAQVALATLNRAPNPKKTF
ncbi:MAG: hypothetical protein WCF54_09410 [Terracidiphilus sp.]